MVRDSWFLTQAIKFTVCNNFIAFLILFAKHPV